MRTPASVARHPIHPMLVPIPIGLWVFSLICDLIYRFGTGDTVWFTVATYNMVAGIAGLVGTQRGAPDLSFEGSMKEPPWIAAHFGWTRKLPFGVKMDTPCRRTTS